MEKVILLENKKSHMISLYKNTFYKLMIYLFLSWWYSILSQFILLWNIFEVPDFSKGF